MSPFLNRFTDSVNFSPLGSEFQKTIEFLVKDRVGKGRLER